MRGAGPDLRGRPQPLVRVRRRHPDVGDDQVRRVPRGEREQGVGVLDGGDDLVAGPLEDADEALAQQRGVLGEDDPQTGHSILISVGPPGGLVTCRCHQRREPDRQPGQPGAGAVGGGAAHPVVLDRQHDGVVAEPGLHAGSPGPRVAGHVGQRLGHDEVRRLLDRRGGSRPGSRMSTVMGTEERSASSCTAAARPWSTSTLGWMPRMVPRSSASASSAWRWASCR